MKEDKTAEREKSYEQIEQEQKELEKYVSQLKSKLYNSIADMEDLKEKHEELKKDYDALLTVSVLMQFKKEEIAKKEGWFN
ncbi:MAG TPA: hypothetical protein VKZ95_04430 [Sphingobacteriaceae bacterium]|nr:hypothetical protein [Sphingobacteriaceae bacterium]